MSMRMFMAFNLSFIRGPLYCLHAPESPRTLQPADGPRASHRSAATFTLSFYRIELKGKMVDAVLCHVVPTYAGDSLWSDDARSRKAQNQGRYVPLYFRRDTVDTCIGRPWPSLA